MLKRQMTQMVLYKPTDHINELNETVKCYKSAASIEAALAANTNTETNGNEMDITVVNFVGLTKNHSIQKNDILDKKYLITFVEHNRLYTIFYCKEIQNDGFYSYC